MAATGQYVVVYDLSDDKERRGLSKVLEGYGFRVQESAYECVLSRMAREKLTSAISQLNLQTGFVNIYRIDNRAKTISLGKPPARSEDLGPAFVV